MREIVQAPRLPRRQLPVDRRARAGDAAADQRLQPAGDQRARRQHLGQLLLAVLQGAAVGRHASRCTTRSPASRMPYQMPAGGRGYTRVPSLISLWSTRAVPAQQHRRAASTADPSVDGAHEGLRRVDRADAVAGEARARRGARRQGAGRDRPHDRAQRRHDSRSAIVPEALQPAAGHGCTAGCRGWSSAGGDIVLGPIPKGMPVGLLANLKLRAESDDLGDKAAHRRQDRRVRWSSSRSTWRQRPGRRERRGAAQALRQPERADAGAEQVPGLRRQPRPLLRHRRVQPAGRA